MLLSETWSWAEYINSMQLVNDALQKCDCGPAPSDRNSNCGFFLLRRGHRRCEWIGGSAELPALDKAGWLRDQKNAAKLPW
jgi:hypothetical protein